MVQIAENDFSSVAPQHANDEPSNALEVLGVGEGRIQEANNCCRRPQAPFDGNDEALGWAVDSVARTIAFVSTGLFLGVSLINLAKLEAGCVIVIPEGETVLPECNGRVYGVRPSSLVTLYSTVVGIVSATTLPIAGAVLDHTTWRKSVATGTAVIQCAILFIQIFLTESNWMFMAGIQVVAAFFGWVHTLAAFAYLPELTPDPDILATWTTQFNIIFYAALLLFLCYMIPLLYITGYEEDHILSARTASASSFLIAAPCFGYTWSKLMKPRPASQTLMEGSTLWTVGFQKVTRTGGKLRSQYRSLMWFFINVASVEAATLSIGTVSVTYMTDVMQMTSVEIAISIICLFLCGIIGTLLGRWSITYVNPIQSNQICQGVSIFVTSLAALILTGPGQQIQAYIIGGGWGLVAGWKNMVERFTTTQIIPKGQDAEMMGFYLFSSQVFSWLPTLIFTALNEAEVNPRLSLSTMNIFFLGGMLALHMMESYDEVIRIARADTLDTDDSQHRKSTEDMESTEENEDLSLARRSKGNDVGADSLTRDLDDK
jgi:MFS-type transporter involved in bile tolerance (Atg22 family)